MYLKLLKNTYNTVFYFQFGEKESNLIPSAITAYFLLEIIKERIKILQQFCIQKARSRNIFLHLCSPIFTDVVCWKKLMFLQSAKSDHNHEGLTTSEIEITEGNFNSCFLQ